MDSTITPANVATVVSTGAAVLLSTDTGNSTSVTNTYGAGSPSLDSDSSDSDSVKSEERLPDDMMTDVVPLDTIGGSIAPAAKSTTSPIPDEEFDFLGEFRPKGHSNEFSALGKSSKASSSSKKAKSQTDATSNKGKTTKNPAQANAGPSTSSGAKNQHGNKK